MFFPSELEKNGMPNLLTNDTGEMRVGMDQ